MYFVKFRVERHPRHGPAQPQRVTARCWVDTSSPVLAEARARRHLAQTGLEVEEVTEIRPTRRSEFVGDPDGLRQFDLAVIAGVTVQLYGWMSAPRDDPDRPHDRAV